jgi:hypothetical protein
MHQRTGHEKRGFEASEGPTPEFCLPSKFSDDTEERWVVARIGGKRTREGIRYYQVFWEGFVEPSWEPADMIEEDAPLVVKAFLDDTPSSLNRRLDSACGSCRYVDSLHSRHELC